MLRYEHDLQKKIYIIINPGFVVVIIYQNKNKNVTDKLPAVFPSDKEILHSSV